LLVVGTVATWILPIDVCGRELGICRLPNCYLPTPSAPVFVSIVLTSLANFWMLTSDLETVLYPISSPQPPTAAIRQYRTLDSARGGKPIMILALGYSERRVEIGTVGEYPAVLFALAKDRIT
jgi:hypothetical protein